VLLASLEQLKHFVNLQVPQMEEVQMVLKQQETSQHFEGYDS
jgi:hypothetical protein